MPIIRHDDYFAFLDTPGPEIAAGSGPFTGRSLAVKDIYDVAGYRTGCGNPQKFTGSPPATTTAPSVQRLFDAGAEFIGKTQTDELAFSLIGNNAHFPSPVNPAARDRVTGGSSSSSVAAVAAGLADLATGSDTGGSVRAPASHCGLVGLRTSHGAISLDGTMPLAPSFDVFGWFAADMAFYRTIAGLFLPAVAPRFDRIMRLPEQEEVLAGGAEHAVYEASLATVQSVLGEATPEKIGSADRDTRYWCMRRIQAYEAWQAHSDWINAAERQLGPGVKERFKFGSQISPETMQAERIIRQALTEEITNLVGDDGVLVTPTVPGAAPLAAASFEDLQDYRERALRLLCMSGLTGLPELTLPLGTVHGAPFGLSLTGRKAPTPPSSPSAKILEAHNQGTE